MRRKTTWLGMALVGAVLAAAPARAARTEYDLGLGADFWTQDSDGVFEFTFTPRIRPFPGLDLGARVGLLLATTSPATGGIPVDFSIRGLFDPIYVEGVIGPWFFFRGEDVVRAHVGMGAGVRSGRLTVGGEVAYLTGGAIFGFRLGIAL